MTDKLLIPAVREVLRRLVSIEGMGQPDRHLVLRATADLLARLDALDADALAREIGREAVAKNFFAGPWHYDLADDVRAGNQDGTARAQAAIAAARLTLARLGIGEQDAD